MTMAQAEDIFSYWEEQPPAFLVLARIDAMIAAWFGIKQPNRQMAAPMPSASELMPLGMAPVADIHAGLGDVVLDFDELKRKITSERLAKAVSASSKE
jgi:hypothetical protein